MASLFSSMSGLFGNDTQTSNNGQAYDNDYEEPHARGPQDHQRSRMAPAQEGFDGSQLVDENDDNGEREDLLDQHVAYYLKHHPEVHTKHNLVRIRPGIYNINGREIAVEWHYADHPGEQGFLIAIDGPLRQPFADYMENSERGINYDTSRLGRSSLAQVPKGKRLSFGDGNKVYSRLEAMKVAKEQALVREKAADFVTAGMQVPQYELMAKYNKTMSQKLGSSRQRAPQPEAQMPAESPVGAPAALQLPLPPPASVVTTPGKAKQTHGCPKYCANHDKTEKRKKVKPQHLPCSNCGQVIQTNYKEFSICPTCSERDHRCMCCGCTAVGGGGAPTPQACHMAPSSPMNARASLQSRSSPQAKSPTSSPANLFGMPDLGFGMPAAGLVPENSVGLYSAAQGVWQGQILPAAAAATKIVQQSNAFAAGNAVVSQSPMASQNAYASQNAFVSQNGGYNAMVSQNVVVGTRHY